jgi:hypothetical protein
MLGALYYVADVSINPTRIKLIRVTDRELLREIGVENESITTQLGSEFGFSSMSGDYHSNRMGVKAITAGVSNGKPAEARITFRRPEDSTSSSERTMVAKPGDVVDVSERCQLIVVKIVPPDDKRKIVGWVEFAPKPPIPQKK